MTQQAVRTSSPHRADGKEKVTVPDRSETPSETASPGATPAAAASHERPYLPGYYLG